MEHDFVVLFIDLVLIKPEVCVWLVLLCFVVLDLERRGDGMYLL